MSSEKFVDDTPAHLTKDFAANCIEKSSLTDREWFCKRCGSRITQGIDRDQEYGHELDCEHSCYRTRTRDIDD